MDDQNKKRPLGTFPNETAEGSRVKGIKLVTEYRYISQTIPRITYVLSHLANVNVKKTITQFEHGPDNLERLKKMSSLPQNDRETLQRIQMGDIDFDFELWQNISREAKHFVANMLVYKPEERMSVRQALAHPWLQILRQPGIEMSEQYQISTERLRNYYNGLKYG